MTVSFTPHLMPFSRGMESDIYVKLAPGVTADDLRGHLARVYAEETFVRVLPKVGTAARALHPAVIPLGRSQSMLKSESADGGAGALAVDQALSPPMV